MSDRLNKYLALHLGVSRREADTLIEKGQVLVNGEKAILGGRVEDTDMVEVNGKSVTTSTELQYIILNKPVGYVSSRKQQGDNPTIYSLLPDDLHALKSVGRLDQESSGLLLLSNDGDFTYTMTHPKFYKTKQYIVTLDQPLQPLHHQMINDFGIALEDGPSKLTLQRENEKGTMWQVTMTEGRNRQIRRTFAALGYEVTALHRTHFGPYALEELKPGEFVSVDKK